MKELIWDVVSFGTKKQILIQKYQDRLIIYFAQLLYLPLITTDFLSL